MVGDINMSISYQLYESSCFRIPAIYAAALSSGILVHGMWLAYIAWNKKWDWKRYGLHLFMLIGVGVVVFVQIGILYNGGIYLYDENETDAVEIQGEITSIKELSSFSFPRIHGDYDYEEKHGYEFTINGIQCIFVAKGSLETGDYVTIKYLPKSGYILYIAETDRNIADIE